MEPVKEFKFKQFNPENEANIPTALKNHPNWVFWKEEPGKDGKPTKVLYNPKRPAKKASSTDPTTWGTYQEALTAFSYRADDSIRGIGFVTTGSPYTVIDLDHCVDGSGKVTGELQEIIDSIKSYAEITPSGTGVHVLVGGKLKEANGRRKAGIEVYSENRFMTVTGLRLPGFKTIEPRQDELNKLYEDYFAQSGSSPPPNQQAGTSNLTDDQVFDHILKSDQKEKFNKLYYEGDTTEYDHDDSRADLALCSILAFWTNRDPVAIDRLFRQSRLCRDKWERRDYRERTIKKAIEGTTNVYTPTESNTECGSIFHWNDDQKINRVTEHTESREKKNLVFPVSSFGGLAKEFAETYSKYLESPVSFLIMAFLTVLGVLIANRVTLRSQIHPQPRLYTVLVGESGDDRKSECIRQVTVFFKTFLERFLKFERFAFTMCEGAGSAEGLAVIFNKIPMLLVYDELKSFVSKAQIETSVLLQVVNSLFDHNSVESATKKRAIHLTDARLSVLAASTRETFERMWTPAFLDIGFINRMFIVTGVGVKRFAIPQRIPESEMECLFNRLAEILDFVNRMAGDGIYEMPIDEDARLLFEKWYLSTPREKYYKRLDTYGHRLMILLSINECLDRVTRDIVQKVIDILNWQADVRRDTTPIDAETLIAKIEGAIKSRLSREGGELKKWKLEKTCHKERFGTKWWNLTVRDLIEAGEIIYAQKIKTYFLIDPEKDE